MAASEELGGSLDVDVEGLVDLDFKTEHDDFFDFDSGGEFGLFGEAGVALHTTANSGGQSAAPAPACTPTTNHPLPPLSYSHKKTSATKKTKPHWDATEIDFFHKGLELFGNNWKRISSFITTKSPSQVRSFHKKWAETASVVQESDASGGTYIFMTEDSTYLTSDLVDPLALIETCTSTGKRNCEDGSQGSELFVPSIGEEWVIEPNGLVSLNPDTVKNSTTEPTTDRVLKKTTTPHKTKKRKSSSGTSLGVFTQKFSHKHKEGKHRKRLFSGTKKTERSQDLHTENVPRHKNSDNRGGGQVSAAVELGQVVHLVKNEEESDVDIDVSDEEQLMIVDKVPSQHSSAAPHQKKESKSSDECSESEGESHVSCNNVELDSKKQQVYSFLPPTEERIIDIDGITEEERKIHVEYFDGKGVKTPERYFKIRNYIINYWKQVKPKYVRKTAVRPGLKNCGDVNSIGKVHDYLEKTGIINFGCAESNYTSPLVVGIKPKEKPQSHTKPVIKVDRSDMARQKQKKKLDMSLCEGGGLTISHDESGAVVDACHIPEAPRGHTGPSHAAPKLEQFKLIRCLEHDPDTPAPFSVVMHAHALILLDLHAHTSRAEVMGLLGGYYDPTVRLLHVTVSVATRAATSGMECDMCPVSQSAACNAIHEGGVQVVGWYHSHPTFPPNPSVQDVSTQSEMQGWFARQEAPFLGVIVSPFCPINQSQASQVRCIVLDRPPHASPGSKHDPVPYKLAWRVSEVVPGAWEEVFQGVQRVVASARQDPMAVEWRGEWRTNFTHWEKAIASLNHHLPTQLQEQLVSVRNTFLAAVRENLDT